MKNKLFKSEIIRYALETCIMLSNSLLKQEEEVVKSRMIEEKSKLR